MRSLLRSTIANATVTDSDLTARVSLRIDPFLLRAAELLPFEEVEVVNLATAERLRTYVEPAEEGSGTVGVHSGARRGDVIAILAFGVLHDGQTLDHKPRIVIVDANNRVVTAK